MAGRLLLLALLCWLGCSASALAQPADAPVADPAARFVPGFPALAALPLWRALLHVPPGQARSEVLSPDFFLSTSDPGAPEAELRAAVQAAEQLPGAQVDTHPRCRFPARYLWLQQQGVVSAVSWRCPGLERWAQFDRLRSASLLLVSGYFGNPASSFGHTLLRLNTDDPDEPHALLNVSLNFGALVPPKEPVPRYIWRGLFGGYQAGFSDRYFYSEDLVYSHNEGRDIWDYELALQGEPLRLLVAHLFEMVGRKFDYYFLHRNCAYRLAEVLALVSGQPLTTRGQVWYAPVEIFHRMQEAADAGAAPLWTRVRYVPSAERLMRHAFARLAPAARVAAGLAVRAAPADIGARLASLPLSDQADALEALLRHAQFLEVAEEPEVSASTRERIANILRLRLALPPAVGDPPPPPLRVSPALGMAPATLGIGWLREGRQSAEGSLPVTPATDRLLLRAAAFDYHATGDHGLDGSELVVADAALSVARQNGGLHGRIEQFDVLRVSKLDDGEGRLGDEPRPSWQVLLGARRHGHLGGDQLRLQVGGGWGAALPWHGPGRGLLFAMLEAHVLSNPGALAGGPRLGLRWAQGDWSGALDLAWQTDSSQAQARWLAQGQLRYRAAGSRLEWRLNGSRDTRTRLALTVGSAW